MSARVVLGSAEVQIGAPAVRSPFPNPPLSSQHPWLPQTLPSRTGSCGRSALRPAVPRGDRRPVPLPSVDASPETATAPDHRRGVPSHVTRPLCPAHGLGSGTVGETQDSPPTGRCAARTAPAASPRPRVPACRRGRGRVARCLLSAPSPSSKVTGHQTLSWREDDTPWPLCSFPGAAHLGGRGIFSSESFPPLRLVPCLAPSRAPRPSLT